MSFELNGSFIIKALGLITSTPLSIKDSFIFELA